MERRLAQKRSCPRMQWPMPDLSKCGEPRHQIYKQKEVYTQELGM